MKFFIPCLYLLLAGCVEQNTVMISPKQVDIPKYSWEPYFFNEINRLENQVDWVPLRGEDMPPGTLEIRVWHGFGSTSLKGIKYRKENEIWTGLRVEIEKSNVLFKELDLQQNQTNMLTNLKAMGLFALPESIVLPNFFALASIKAPELDSFYTDLPYVVEINDGECYRAYKHGRPRYGWELIMFEPINKLTEKLGLTPLRELELSEDSLEIRIWINVSFSPWQGFRLLRNGADWAMYYLTEEGSFETEPLEGWEIFWKNLEELDILTLPDDSTLPNKRFIHDGIGLIFEINDGGNYRTYSYSNPEHQEWPEAKKIIKIMEMFGIIIGE